MESDAQEHITPEMDAREYLDSAFHCQMEGEVERAIVLYSKSIEIHPTAEAYTFRGWSYSFLGNLNRAIEECRKAIKVDPGFGNPYNDIGAYLIQQGKLDEAIPWLVKAIKAPRYDARCYPYLNLGRIYEQKMDWLKARACYEKALKENPDYAPAKQSIDWLIAVMN